MTSIPSVPRTTGSREPLRRCRLVLGRLPTLTPGSRCAFGSRAVTQSEDGPAARRIIEYLVASLAVFGLLCALLF